MAPSAAARTATSAPIPRLLPVTRMTRPSSAPSLIGNSVRVRVRLGVVADGDPLPLGELVPVGRAAEAAAVARAARAAERDGCLVVHGLVVHVSHAGLHPLRQREATRDRSRVDGARQAVL